jgi:hypothetical protein
MVMFPDPLKPYQDQGFLVMPRLFAFDEIAWVRDEARIVALRRVQRGRVPEGAAWAGEAPDGTVYGAHLTDSTFRKLAAHPRMLTLARKLVGEDVYVHQSRLVSRFADVPTDHEWRRDFASWSATDGMTTPRAVTAAVVLGEPTLQAPVLHVAPGSQRVPGGTVDPGLPLTAPLGSVVFYHADLAYAFNRAGDRRSPPLFLVSYNAVGNLPQHPERDEIYAARRATPPVVESDDCMWPSSWFAAG